MVANFNNYNFPLDSIWLDIDYADGRRYFTWKPDSFGDPVEMQQNISATYKKLVAIIDPHIKAETGFFVYDGGIEADVFVKNQDGSVFEGDCWPGTSTYVDFLNPAGRDYYASLYAYDKFNGSTPTLAGIWNDMNEPTVFADDLEKTMANDIPHYPGDVLHRDVHNIYGLLNVLSKMISNDTL